MPFSALCVAFRSHRQRSCRGASNTAIEFAHLAVSALKFPIASDSRGVTWSVSDRSRRVCSLEESHPWSTGRVNQGLPNGPQRDRDLADRQAKGSPEDLRDVLRRARPRVVGRDPPFFPPARVGPTHRRAVCGPCDGGAVGSGRRRGAVAQTEVFFIAPVTWRLDRRKPAPKHSDGFLNSSGKRGEV